MLELDYSISSCFDKVRSFRGPIHWKTTSPSQHRGLRRFYLMKSTHSQDKVKQIVSMLWITKYDHPGSHLNFKSDSAFFVLVSFILSVFHRIVTTSFFASTYTPRNMIGLNMLQEYYKCSSYWLLFVKFMCKSLEGFNPHELVLPHWLALSFSACIFLGTCRCYGVELREGEGGSESFPRHWWSIPGHEMT